MSKKIVVITSGKFPEGEPGAVRIRMICKALAKSGYIVTVLCRGKVRDENILDDSIKYYSLRTVDEGTIKKIIDYIIFGYKVRKKIFDLNKIEFLYLYNAPVSVFKWAKRYSKNKNVQLIHDCVEWYSPEEFKLGKYNPIYIIKNYINTKVIDENFKIIAISDYLNKYFKSKKIDSIKIPMLCDLDEFSMIEKKSDNQLHLFYAGTPAKKDLVGNVIKAMLLIPEEKQNRLKFTIVGCTKQYLLENCGVNNNILNAANNMLEISGRISRQEVAEKMESADFIVLARDASLRYAKAGFPSKIVEGLYNSTPILCNLFSDLGEYLVDRQNAIISLDHSPEELAIAIERALTLTPEAKKCMSIRSFETSVDYFDYRNYVDVLNEFIG